MSKATAEILREYGPYPDIEHVHGVSYDGRQVWFAVGDGLRSLNPETGDTSAGIVVPARAGTAFDGECLYQIAGDVIRRIDPVSGEVLATIPAPADGGNSGMAWAEGFLWVGQHRGRRIHQVDPATGRVVRSIETRRFVTGVTWVDGELWHGTWEGQRSALRRIDPGTGESLQHLDMPPGTGVSGLASDGRDRFFCGGGGDGKLRAVRRSR